MFNCRSHNWSHIEKPCPLCNPMQVYSTNTACINTVTVDSLQAELTSLKAKYQKAVETLKFYGDKNNWTCEVGWDGYLVSGVISSTDNETFEASFDYGGKLARQTLAEIEE